MADSIWKLKPALVQILSDMRDPPTDLTRQDWELLEKVIRVLKPFKEATEWLSKSDASISLGIPMITTIRKSLEVLAGIDRGVMGMKRNLTDAMDTRFAQMEETIHYSAATILDSKFKHRFFRDPACMRKAKDYIVDEISADLRREAETDNRQVTRVSWRGRHCSIQHWTVPAYTLHMY